MDTLSREPHVATDQDTMTSSTRDVQLILEGLVSLASQGLQEIDLQENFCVIQKLGDGGYGSVLMVQDKKTDQKMALKLLDRNKTTEFAFLMEFSKSFFLSSHPNIIGSYGTAFKTWDYFAFAQELSIGDLCSLITPHDGLPEDTVKRCAVQISSALEFIDSKGLVHLDIKPENILIFDEDCYCIKITDFGLSCIKGTMAKNRIGTVSYMAPEISQVTDKDCLLLASLLFVLQAKRMEPISQPQPGPSRPAKRTQTQGCLSSTTEPSELDYSEGELSELTTPIIVDNKYFSNQELD
ncbi:serine/threonine-protein kinase SBK1-like [Eleutherodactylus coqui]|uniref:serine/threonine-protein kinase SBK1-like n=1 Tax=Eleutherodactylus coqui TaxID=57060 RepID=UPI003462F0C3